MKARVNVLSAVESHPIAGTWAPGVLTRYRQFAATLAGDHELEVTIGRGGLSFYAETAAGRTFICHFNAAPRIGREDLGFVDFRPLDLAPQLDPHAVVADLRQRLGASVELRSGKIWHSAHFDSGREVGVAESFRQSVVEPLVAGQ